MRPQQCRYLGCSHRGCCRRHVEVHGIAEVRVLQTVSPLVTRSNYHGLPHTPRHIPLGILAIVSRRPHNGYPRSMGIANGLLYCGVTRRCWRVKREVYDLYPHGYGHLHGSIHACGGGFALLVCRLNGNNLHVGINFPHYLGHTRAVPVVVLYIWTYYASSFYNVFLQAAHTCVYQRHGIGPECVLLCQRLQICLGANGSIDGLGYMHGRICTVL